jgi:hypothetical protein
MAVALASAGLALAACGGSSGVHGAIPTQTNAAASTPSAAALARTLRQDGLKVTGLIVYTTVTDPNHEMGRQGGYSSKVAWVDPRALKAGAGHPSSDKGGTEFGGGIEVFPTVAGARSRLEYLKAFTPPFGDGYDYLAGSALLRLSNYLTPVQAVAYKAAFDKAAS